MRDVFAPIELLQAFSDLLAKPCVMIEVMLDKLLDVPVGIAAVLSGDAVHLRFQIGAEMYFHGLENKDSAGGCQ